MHSTMRQQQQKKICLRKMSISSHEGNLMVIHRLIAADRQIDALLKLNDSYTGVTDQAKI